MDKWKCNECNWTGGTSEILNAVNPFDPDKHVSGCPECKSIETLVAACDEPGCNQEGTCGFSTETGYRRTCFKHSKFYKENLNGTK